MSMHPNPAERLLLMLDDDRALEAMPSGEVREDLAAFGIDSARSIAFAKALSQGGGSPGRRLMGALLAAEEEDEEIARIEIADIEDVRARIPHAAAASIAAETRRKAGIDDNVIGLAERRRKRRRLIVWGGPLAGIAASLLVVAVFMGNAYLTSDRSQVAYESEAKRALAPAPAMPDPAAEGYAKPGPDKSPSDELLALDVPPELQPADRAKEKSLADNDGAGSSGEVLALNEQAAPPPATAENKADAPARPEARLRKQEEESPPPPAMAEPAREPAEEDSKVAAAPAAPVESLGATAGAEGNVAANAGRSGAMPETAGVADPRKDNSAGESFEAETGIAALPRSDGDEGTRFGRAVEISEIAAVLVVDPSQAPLQIQSPILPSGELANRVEEARRLAGDRPLIALYTVKTGEKRQDFAQVPLQSGLTQQLAAPPPLVGLLGVEATEYDFIALPAE